LHHWSCQTGLSSAWGRIFHLYGPYEYPGRLVPSVIRALLRGEPANCSDGRQVRDYLYVEDVASAFVCLVESELQRPVNIASGVPVSVKELIGRIGEKIGRPDLIRLGALGSTQEPPHIVAMTSRLREEAGWRPHYDLDAGLERTIDWWRKNADLGETQFVGRSA
jgi:nucleoside-diphosphate-sugar epimerase